MIVIGQQLCDEKQKYFFPHEAKSKKSLIRRKTESDLLPLSKHVLIRRFSTSDVPVNKSMKIDTVCKSPKSKAGQCCDENENSMRSSIHHCDSFEKPEEISVSLEYIWSPKQTKKRYLNQRTESQIINHMDLINKTRLKRTASNLEGNKTDDNKQNVNVYPSTSLISIFILILCSPQCRSFFLSVQKIPHLAKVNNSLTFQSRKRHNTTAQIKVKTSANRLQSVELNFGFKTLFHNILSSFRPQYNEVTVFPADGNSLDSFFQSFQNGSSIEDSMKFEWVRLRSFASFRCRADVSPIFLSRLGFYYTGSGSEVKCFSCSASYNEWCPGDNVLDVHRRISPECRHIAGSDERNVPIGHRTVNSSHSLDTSCSVSSQGDQITNSTRQRNVPIGNRTVNISENRNINGLPVNYNRLTTQGNENISASSRSQTTPGTLGYRQENRERSVLMSSAVEGNGLAASPVLSSNRSASNHSEQHQRRITQSGQSTITSIPSSGQPARPNDISNSPRSSSVSEVTINKLSPLGVNFDKPRYPQYAVFTVRMSTYNGWLATQSPREMAEAGFIYAGYADYTRCFFCGGGLRNWEEGDDPWIEHARWFPRCAYVRQNKCDQFVQLVHERLQETLSKAATSAAENSELPNQCFQSKQQSIKQNGVPSSKQSGQPEAVTNINHLPSYQSVLELGYAPGMIENIFQTLTKDGKRDITSGDILEVIFRLEEGDAYVCPEINSTSQESEEVDDEDTSQIVKENERLKLQKLCMVCVENDSCVTFLPCAHLVCCEDCAPAMRRCPKCQELVQGSIKTWLV